MPEDYHHCKFDKDPFTTLANVAGVYVCTYARLLANSVPIKPTGKLGEFNYTKENNLETVDFDANLR